ncbi:MAG TPA: hypothetical protein VE987_18155 [Polyangiaceae bacterium]|nr:hypothetical protein [Polyangiaceae bacterium]
MASRLPADDVATIARGSSRGSHASRGSPRRRAVRSAPAAAAAVAACLCALSPGRARADEPTPSPPPPDELAKPGYIPGYRADPSIGTSPYTPRVGALPGGMTPGYGAPTPASDWNFRWTGFVTASLQASMNQRPSPAPGQSTTTIHVPPQTVDEYGSFVGTSTMPGQWAQLNFVYGNRFVSANLSLTTWNPTDPTSYYAIGSQQFINNFFLAYSPPPVLGVRVRALAGYFYNAYGAIGQYGLGMYTNAIVGGVRGVGEDVVAEYDATETVTLSLEDGIMGNRNGMGAINIIPNSQNGAGTPIIWPSAWIHHVHAGLESRGDVTMRAGLHYLTNWAQDDRVQVGMDNLQTRQIDEAYVRDGRIQTFGVDATFLHPILGHLGLAFSYTRAQDAYPVKGLVTFGGDGESLTNRWFGDQTTGTGTLVAAGINYTASLGRILSYPVPFNGDGPDLALQAGFIFAESWADTQAGAAALLNGAQPFDGRARYKGGVDLLYTFLPFMAAGVRTDVVVPNSHDAEETFAVLSPRLVFKSDWGSRDTVSIIYGKWFYGPHSHPEASTITPSDRLDDQLFAVNAQMWW